MRVRRQNPLFDFGTGQNDQAANQAADVATHARDQRLVYFEVAMFVFGSLGQGSAQLKREWKRASKISRKSHILDKRGKRLATRAMVGTQPANDARRPGRGPRRLSGVRPRGRRLSRLRLPSAKRVAACTARARAPSASATAAGKASSARWMPARRTTRARRARGHAAHLRACVCGRTKD